MVDSQLALVHRDDRARVWAGMELAVSTGRPFSEDYRIQRPDGTTRDLRVRAQPTFGSTGDVVGLRGIGQDVTAQ
jgi:PAS domain S-box-containing protein